MHTRALATCMTVHLNYPYTEAQEETQQECREGSCNNERRSKVPRQLPMQSVPGQVLDTRVTLIRLASLQL